MKRPTDRVRGRKTLADAFSSGREERSDVLRESEWNFRPLIHKHPTQNQREELRAAIYYEYARESASICGLAQKYAEWRKPNAAASDTELPEPITTASDLCSAEPEALFHFTWIPFWNCIFWPEFFPNKTWLEIPPQERTRRVQTFVEWQQKPLLKINEWDELAPHEIPKRGARCMIGTGENLILWLNWAVANNREIVDAIASWVHASRPKEYPEPRGDGSRENVTSALLTRLAVMRLLNFYPLAGVLDKALEFKDGEMRIPKLQSHALRMRHAVRRDLHRLFQAESFKKIRVSPLIPALELPRRWKKFPAQ